MYFQSPIYLIESLRILDLRENKIKTIYKELKGLKLQEINLSKNEIEVLEIQNIDN